MLWIEKFFHVLGKKVNDVVVPENKTPERTMFASVYDVTEGIVDIEDEKECGRDDVDEEKECEHEWRTVKYHTNRDVYKIVGLYGYDSGWELGEPPECLVYTWPKFPLDRVCIKCGECDKGWDDAIAEIQEEWDKDDLAEKIWEERCCK